MKSAKNMPNAAKKHNFFARSVEQGLVHISRDGTITRSITKTLQSAEGQELAKSFMSNKSLKSEA